MSDATFLVTARVLGALFYYPPDSPQAASLVAAFRNNCWADDWQPGGPALAPLRAGFCADSDESLEEAWQRLFIGPWALPAPPWGSVWLDKESVLFGESTLALRQWMREHNIVFDTRQNEPEDHFGALLLMVAWLTEQGNLAARDALLAWHLLPWSARFLEVFTGNAQHPFWRSLGQLAQLTLSEWQSQLLMPVAQKPLFR
ncbi:Tat proofreading chaperone DmsD [Vagococcus sp. WN89Y]|uniref:Tat proofreading chaperone DmsD n=1 Tax=Vagococcus sp. WN89Y TaxID=3457258 RepID=UPI003FCD1390